MRTPPRAAKNAYSRLVPTIGLQLCRLKIRPISPQPQAKLTARWVKTRNGHAAAVSSRPRFGRARVAASHRDQLTGTATRNRHGAQPWHVVCETNLVRSPRRGGARQRYIAWQHLERLRAGWPVRFGNVSVRPLVCL